MHIMHIMQKLCRNYAKKKIMQKLWKNYAKIMQKLCNVPGLHNNACIMQKLCKLCKNYANYASLEKLCKLCIPHLEVDAWAAASLIMIKTSLPNSSSIVTPGPKNSYLLSRPILARPRPAAL